MKELKEKIEYLKKTDLYLKPGFYVTAEYRLGEIRGYNDAIDEILLLITRANPTL